MDSKTMKDLNIKMFNIKLLEDHWEKYLHSLRWFGQTFQAKIYSLVSKNDENSITLQRWKWLCKITQNRQKLNFKMTRNTNQNTSNSGMEITLTLTAHRMFWECSAHWKQETDKQLEQASRYEQASPREEMLVGMNKTSTRSWSNAN